MEKRWCLRPERCGKQYKERKSKYLPTPFLVIKTERVNIMTFSLIEESLLKAFEEFEIVDAHEHLPPEKIRLDQKVDVFTLFSQYTKHPSKRNSRRQL